MASSTSTPTHTPNGETTKNGEMQQELLQKLLRSNDVAIPPHGITDPFNLPLDWEESLIFPLNVGTDRFSRLRQAPTQEPYIQMHCIHSVIYFAILIASIGTTKLTSEMLEVLKCLLLTFHKCYINLKIVELYMQKYTSYSPDDPIAIIGNAKKRNDDILSRYTLCRHSRRYVISFSVKDKLMYSTRDSVLKILHDLLTECDPSLGDYQLEFRRELRWIIHTCFIDTADFVGMQILYDRKFYGLPEDFTYHENTRVLVDGCVILESLAHSCIKFAQMLTDLENNLEERTVFQDMIEFLTRLGSTHPELFHQKNRIGFYPWMTVIGESYVMHDVWAGSPKIWGDQVNLNNFKLRQLAIVLQRPHGSFSDLYQDTLQKTLQNELNNLQVFEDHLKSLTPLDEKFSDRTRKIYLKQNRVKILQTELETYLQQCENWRIFDEKMGFPIQLDAPCK